MVHQARKDQGKRNITVFGVASDGEDFRYYRIDNKSQVIKSSFCLVVTCSLITACPISSSRLGGITAPEGNSISTTVDNPRSDYFMPIADSDQRGAAT